MVQTILRDGRNTLIDSYRSDRLSVTCAEEYSIAGHGSRDIFRDMIVLKHATAREKGVILLKYTRTFEAVVSLFDLSRLRDRYLFVLEPCWAGYCDPSILLFIAHGHPVVIQCFTEADYQFIESIGTPLVPVRLGPADWVDADLFTPVQTDTKPYDLVMVANWASHKRHAQLFRALSGVNGRQLRVLLIGFPWGGRTASDIRREAAAVKNDLIQIDVIEQVPPRDVARYVSQCKVFVFLSRKEGDNKALVEAMFADVPAIVFDKTIGGARNRINRSTGIFSSDEDLRRNILYMLDHYQEFSPRAWALQHTGSSIATGILNGVVKRMVIDSGGKFTEDLVEKTNSPNLAYKDSTCRLRFQADYEFILSSRRESLRSRKT
jgi:glycosyltransferase involved in cell wall biosynthesis